MATPETLTKDPAPKPAKAAVAVKPVATLLPTQTTADRSRLFARAAKGIEPAHKRTKPEDPLRIWWPQVKHAIGQGYTVPQIRTILASPEIGVKTSLRSLERLISAHQPSTPAPSVPPTS